MPRLPSRRILAIFPVVGEDKQAPCRAALLAAEESLRALQSLNVDRAGEAPLGTGIALHLGEVMYGNIGGRERLDFTVIGSSVNEAARVEALCKELERPLLMTAPFVEAVGDPSIVRLGAYALRGVATPHEIFTKPL